MVGFVGVWAGMGETVHSRGGRPQPERPTARDAPATFFSLARRKEEAEDAGLMSLSAGEGDDRYVVVYKSDCPPPPELVEMEREAEEAKAAAEDDMRRREEVLAAAAKETARLREAAAGHAGGAASARPLTAAQRRQAQIESLARGAETVKMTEKIEKRTVGQIQDECLAHRAREA